MPRRRLRRSTNARPAPRPAWSRSSPTTKATRPPCSARSPSTTWRRSAKTKRRGMAFVAPTVNIPVTMPITVRSASDYGLRLNVDGHLPGDPAEPRRASRSGASRRDPDHDGERFPPGSPGSPPGCVGSLTRRLPRRAASRRPACCSRPFTNNPSVCTGAAAAGHGRRDDSYQDPNNPAHGQQRPIRRRPAAKTRSSTRSSTLGLTTAEADAPSGMDMQLKADQFLGRTPPSPSTLRSATLTLPDGPLGQPGRRRRPDLLHATRDAGFGTEQRRRTAPTTRRSARSKSTRRRSTAR